MTFCPGRRGELVPENIHSLTLHFCGYCTMSLINVPIYFLLSDVISKRTTFIQPFLLPSDPPANAP